VLCDKSRDFYRSDKFLRALEIFILSVITIFGFILRYHKVGKDSFWLDEAGQALAALQPRIIDTLMIVRQHAGAMPLDYLVSRIMASVSLDEKVMRLPSVVWGTLLIAIYFFLVRELDFPHKKPVSFLVSLLLVFSPIYIQYSQEMRFYAALSFFYAASTFLLIRAIKDPSNSNWLFYIVVTLIGEYFHPYVLFTVMTGFILILRNYIPYINSSSQFSNDKGNLLKFILASMILIVLYIPGYLFFNAGQSFSYGLGLQLDSVLEGLGLQAYVLGRGLGPFGLWHVMLLIGAIGGLLLVGFRYRKYDLVVSLLIAFFLQFILIIGLDIYKQYFFAPRQLLHLAPLLLILTAMFIVECITILRVRSMQYILWLTFLGIIIISPLPYIKAIYDYSKGNGGVIAQAIISEYRPGQKVLIFTSGYEIIMDYYFMRFEKPDQPLPITLVANNMDELGNAIKTNNGVAYIVVPKDAPPNIRVRILLFGYKNYFGKPLPDFLFMRLQ
jgi:uncharacterized membrane protein